MSSRIGVWARRSVLGVAGGVGLAYASSPGFRRSVTFWTTIAPFFAEYQGIKARAMWESADPSDRIADFHARSSKKAVGIILQLGGIYVKVGQFASTMGAGILQDSYVQALRPLQDGVPPRSLEEVSSIIESSVGKQMSELFLSFDESPVGAASIAQAHRATLLDGREVVVKVQYPEVEGLFRADFDNLEICTRLLFPENMTLIRGLRKRHSAELDFRVEARNLRESRDNLRSRGFEPLLVRVPTVSDERLCTRHVLAMELLRGESLASALEAEMADVAHALGFSAEELRTKLMRNVQEHFEGGGGAHRLMYVAEVAAPLVRTYAAALRHWRSAVACACRCIAACLSCIGLNEAAAAAATAAAAAADQLHRPRPDISRVVRTLVRVQGCAMLLDGFYNADPHPGNVLLLPDGRLGLIDYGLVGRLTVSEREAIARVTLGLAAGDVDGVAAQYEQAGYKACWHSAGIPQGRHGKDVVFRFATFHLDRINLAPVHIRASAGPMGSTSPPQGSEGCITMPVMKLFRSTIEIEVPDWVEQARRLGGLLIGVASQAGRPISLAHEWAPIAEELLTTSADRHNGAAAGSEGGAASASDANRPCGAGGVTRLRTHLTGLSI